MTTIQLLTALQCTSLEQIEMYFHSNEIGHSKLVDFETYGPAVLKEDKCKEPTPAMIFGSVVDTLLTHPDLFDKLYYVPECSDKLTDSENAVVEVLIRNGYSLDNYSLADFSDSTLLEILDAANYYKSYLNKTRIEKIRKRSDIIDERLRNANKTPITSNELEKAVKCIEILKTSNITGQIFESDVVLYQVQLNKSISARAGCHCMFDIIAIDTKNHKIYPFDLKTTTAPETEFLRSFYNFKYYRQAEMYMDILNDAIITRTSDYSKWQIEPFRFIVISPSTQAPLIYEFPIVYNKDNQLQISNHQFVPMYSDIVKEMIWHIETGQFEYSKDIYTKIYRKTSENNSELITIPIFQLSETKTSNEDSKESINDDGDLQYLQY